ncbi:MAG: YxeA family protein [Lachnospiraceae bacterium]|nr:YxeA family protein [Lachnospiraceae bacterium]
MKNKIWIGIGVVIVLVIGLSCFSAWFFSEKDSGYYYVQIDNNKIEEVNSRGGVINLHGSMDYSYTLTGYDENGQGTYITFGASRELREGAYLRLTVKPIRGVTEWSEVEYEEMPAAVQEKFEG